MSSCVKNCVCTLSTYCISRDIDYYTVTIVRVHCMTSIEAFSFPTVDHVFTEILTSFLFDEALDIL